MSWIKVGEQTLWSNSGVGVLATLASGSEVWLAGGGTTVTATPAVTQWNRIDLNKVDHLILQYDSRIIDKGGISAASAGELWVGAVGWFSKPPSTLIVAPAATLVAPNAFLSTTEQLNGKTLWGLSGDFVGAIRPLVSGSIAVAQGLLPDATLADGMQSGFNMEIGVRPNGNVGGNTGDRTALSVSGLETVWIAIASKSTLTGTLLTTKLEAYMRVLMFRDQYVQF